MKIVKRILKYLLLTVLGAAVLLTAIVILTRPKASASSTKPAETGPVEPPALDFTMEDSPEPLSVDTYTETGEGRNRRLSIYDADYLDLFFDYDSVTAEETKQVVRDNPAITPRFRELLYWYIDAIARKYPEADLRILHYNLQTLEVVETDAHTLAFEALSLDAYGCYKRVENKIYVNQDYEYTPGTWEYQVIIHEFGHAARTIQRSTDEGTVDIQLSREYLVIPEEALNSLFTVSLFDYALADYINHSLTYLAHKLDEQTGYNNYAMNIFRLIDEQRADYMDDKYEREQSVYYPIYDYVCRLYLGKHGAADMDEAGRKALVDELVERVTYDVPADHPLDTEEFYRCAEAMFPEPEA